MIIHTHTHRHTQWSHTIINESRHAHVTQSSLDSCAYTHAWQGEQTGIKPQTYSRTLNTSILRIVAHTHISVCSWHLDVTRQPVWRNEEGGRPAVQREPAEPLSRAAGWLKPWKAFSRSGQREPGRHIEWVWERNVSETKSEAIGLVREVCVLVITWACIAAWVEIYTLTWSHVLEEVKGRSPAQPELSMIFFSVGIICETVEHPHTLLLPYIIQQTCFQSNIIYLRTHNQQKLLVERCNVFLTQAIYFRAWIHLKGLWRHRKLWAVGKHIYLAHWPSCSKVENKHPHLLPEACLNLPDRGTGERKRTRNGCFTARFFTPLHLFFIRPFVIKGQRL